MVHSVTRVPCRYNFSSVIISYNPVVYPAPLEDLFLFSHTPSVCNFKKYQFARSQTKEKLITT